MMSFMPTRSVRTALLLGMALWLGACSNGLPDFTDLVEKTGPAIVHIRGESQQGSSAGGGETQPPLFEWFRDFMQPPPDESPRGPRHSMGSGLVLSADGEILTNNHVVAQVDSIRVTLADGREFEAEVIGRDPASDLALLKIPAKGLPRVRFGDSDRLKVGEWVLAIGAPFGFEQSATAGIVSAKGRALGSEQYVPYLQTDVAINPGNSGGPLFNLRGEVVGINSQIFSDTGGYMGLSFAIPSNTARQVVDQLRSHGEVRRARLGVVIQPVDADLARSFGLDHARGALVSQVEPGSAAERAGIQAGDVIVEVDGEAVASSAALPPMIGARAPGEKIRLRLVRDGRAMNLRLTLDALAPALAQSEDWTGLQLRPLDASQRSRRGLDHGLLIESLRPGSPAAAAGLRPGDVLLNWNQRQLDSLEDLAEAARAQPRGESVPLLVLRQDRSLFLALRRPDNDD